MVKSIKKSIECTTFSTCKEVSLLGAISCLGLTLIVLAFIMMKSNVVSGYEISIYTSVSPLAWVLFIGSIVCGIIIVIYWLSGNRTNRRNWWLVAVLLLALDNVIVLNLPTLRGYIAYGREDNLSQVGYVTDIILTGHVSDLDIYPVTHLLLQSFALVTGISPLWASTCVPSVFMCLYVLSIYSLAKATLRNEKMVGLAVISSTMLNISSVIYMAPWAFAVLTTPLSISLYLRKEIKSMIALIMLMVLYPFFHPLSSLVLIIGFVVMKLTETFLANVGAGLSIIEEKPLTLRVAVMSFILLIIWLSTHYFFWKRNVLTLVSSFVGEAAGPRLLQYSANMLESLGVKGLDVVVLFLKLYGGILVYLMLSMIAMILILRRTLAGERNMRNKLILMGYFAIACSMELANTFNSIFFSYTLRILRFALELSPIFAAFTIYAVCERSAKQSMSGSVMWRLVVVMVPLILVPSVTSVFNTYPSPYTLTPNGQVTYQESNGMKWFFSHRSLDIGVYHLKTYPHRFADAFHGFLRCTLTSLGQIRDHFGYDSNDTQGQTHSPKAYLLITEYDKVFYTEMYPQLNAFSKSDFEKLGHDPNMARLQCNGEFEIWLIRHAQPEES